MKLSPKDQEALLAIVARIYTDLVAIEEEFKLLVGGGDFRPRIEYFHDAMRAYTSEDPKHRETGGRLNVELLAYDLACLRYIQSMPLSSFTPHAQAGSPTTDVISMGDGQALASRQHRPDRNTRERIAELYQNYAVLFSALLKPFADNDYHDRIDDLQHENGEMKQLMEQIAKLAAGKGSANEAANIANHLDSDDLRRLILAFLQEKRYKSRSDCDKLTGALKDQVNKKTKSIKAIEEAHMNYALSQLALYEGSKDMLKKMAGQGMNIVGKFVESSIAATRSELGR